MLRLCFAAIALSLLVGSPVRAIVGEPTQIEFQGSAGAFPLVARGRAAALCVDPADFAGVKRAAGELAADIGQVSSAAVLRMDPPTEAVLSEFGPERGRARRVGDNALPLVLIGTLGHSPAIDRLVQAGRIDVSPLRGQWEAWITQTVDHPYPGVERALVIVGSDKRGTIYGTYDLSQQIGVSPWSWWADVPIPSHPELFFLPGRQVHPSPRVKYRGIFLNDEAPDLSNWVKAKYGTVPVGTNPPVPAGVANYNHEFYSRLFELMLRLRANYLWPAMWNNAFNEDDPENARLADEYGIVMGTSHQEPMLRAQKEWDRRYLKTEGTWNYAKHPQQLEEFWAEGIRRNRAFESIVTIGLRGANDTEMAPGGPAANQALLERIVERQRAILRTEVNPDLTQVPQLWCLYKEVTDYYDAGMRVPDDVTLLWPEDNWGNLRRVPTAAERKRSGGAGIYYHFDYHGDPRSYQWLNTSPLPKIWEQMSLAARAGADRIWIVNVGHFKGYELPTEFFLDLAWNPARWTAANVGTFAPAWAARQFGPGQAAPIAAILEGYAKANARRKPELLAPDTYSLTDYHEAERVVADYTRLAAEADRIGQSLPPAYADAYTELVSFPTRASALVNQIYFAAGQNQLFAAQGRAGAAQAGQEIHTRFQQFQAMMDEYNHQLAGGKWAHFMDQPVLGYTNWRDPPTNSLRAIPIAAANPATGGLPFGVAVEGSSSSWPRERSAARLPEFDSLSRPSHYLEVFRAGDASVDFRVQISAPWIRLTQTEGRLGPDCRIGVSIDWAQVRGEKASGLVTIAAAGTKVDVAVDAVNRPALPRQFHGFVEGGGYVAFEAAHFSRQVEAGPQRWLLIPDYGPYSAAIRTDTTGDLDAPETPLGPETARLEYNLHLYQAGTVNVTAITGPTLNFVPGRGLRYAISWDNEAPQVVTLVPAGYKAISANPVWAQDVSDNAHHGHSRHEIAQPGDHVLKIWMVDPAVVFEKIVVDLGGVRPSYLGPPESFRVR